MQFAGTLCSILILRSADIPYNSRASLYRPVSVVCRQRHGPSDAIHLVLGMSGMAAMYVLPEHAHAQPLGCGRAAARCCRPLPGEMRRTGPGSRGQHRRVESARADCTRLRVDPDRVVAISRGSQHSWWTPGAPAPPPAAGPRPRPGPSPRVEAAPYRPKRRLCASVVGGPGLCATPALPGAVVRHASLEARSDRLSHLAFGAAGGAGGLRPRAHRKAAS